MNIMEGNLLKEKIRDGKKPIGTFCELCSSEAIEALGYSGLDYIIIDNEHSPVEAETTMGMVRAAELGNLTPLARVREISRPAVLKLLDVGVQGLIIPNVKTADEAKNLVSWGKYSPIGNRGFSGSRKDAWGFKLNMSVPETMAYYNERVLLIPQCETVEALACIEDIVEVEGIDGIFIGPYDLSIAMGIPGEFDDPEFLNAIGRIISACKGKGKFTMMFAGNRKAVVNGFQKGVDSMAYSMDAGLMVNGFLKDIKEIRTDLA